MRRDKELLNKLLLLAEGEEPKPDLSAYTQEQQAYHAAILIDSGLIQGDTVKDAEENVIAAAILDLTPQGHDFLERLRGQNRQPVGSEMIQNDIDIFVSHSKHDQELAKALIELLIEALKIPRTRIRSNQRRWPPVARRNINRDNPAPRNKRLACVSRFANSSESCFSLCHVRVGRAMGH